MKRGIKILCVYNQLRADNYRFSVKLAVSLEAPSPTAN